MYQIAPAPDPLTDGADAAWQAMGDSGQSAARCSLWWSGAPGLAGHRPGLIGHYHAGDSAAAAALLDHACAQLRAAGCTIAIGPMDGTTWRRYRLLSERGPEPLFFLEPDNPDDWPRHFTSSGFTVLASYYSAVNEDLARPDSRPADLPGFRIHSLDASRLGAELGRIYDLSLASFRDNLLYSPISEAEFRGMYQGLDRWLVSELVLLAEHDGRLAGYLFAVPDLLQAKRGLPIDTIIIKTLAVHPDFGGAGLGSLLAARCHEAAHRLGYRRAIHALMHETNRSRRISAHTARVIRRYELYARELGPA